MIANGRRQARGGGVVALPVIHVRSLSHVRLARKAFTRSWKPAAASPPGAPRQGAAGRQGGRAEAAGGRALGSVLVLGQGRVLLRGKQARWLRFVIRAQPNPEQPAFAIGIRVHNRGIFLDPVVDLDHLAVDG
jgi:hypothetical protein